MIPPDIRLCIKIIDPYQRRAPPSMIKYHARDGGFGGGQIVIVDPASTVRR